MNHFGSVWRLKFTVLNISKVCNGLVNIQIVTIPKGRLKRHHCRILVSRSGNVERNWLMVTTASIAIELRKSFRYFVMPFFPDGRFRNLFSRVAFGASQSNGCSLSRLFSYTLVRNKRIHANRISSKVRREASWLQLGKRT